jgi:hypothetical protein
MRQGGRLSVSELFESLQDIARELGWRHRECIVLLDGDGAALRIWAASRYFPRFIIVDSTDQQNILTTCPFTGVFLDLVCEQIPISSLAPYQISAPVERSGFFGHEREIDKILRQPEKNFAVIGVRRIGKTSLLKEMRHRPKWQESLELHEALSCPPALRQQLKDQGNRFVR